MAVTRSMVKDAKPRVEYYPKPSGVTKKSSPVPKQKSKKQNSKSPAQQKKQKKTKTKPAPKKRKTIKAVAAKSKSPAIKPEPSSSPTPGPSNAPVHATRNASKESSRSSPQINLADVPECVHETRSQKIATEPPMPARRVGYGSDSEVLANWNGRARSL